MSVKRKRIGMLSALHSSMRDIEASAKTQTEDVLKSNMKILQEHVESILALDGVGFLKEDNQK